MRLVLTLAFLMYGIVLPLHAAPIWPPSYIQQLEMHRIEVVVTHKVSKQQTVLAYHEQFPDAQTAAGMAPVVRGLFFEWLKANYDMNEAEFNEEFTLEIKVVVVPGGATQQRLT